MKRYELNSTELSQYSSLTASEREAWLHPENNTYHSFHIERMGVDTFRWRDSKSANFYIGSHSDLCQALLSLTLRKLDQNYAEKIPSITLLSQSEIDDLFSDL